MKTLDEIFGGQEQTVGTQEQTNGSSINQQSQRKSLEEIFGASAQEQQMQSGLEMVLTEKSKKSPLSWSERAALGFSNNPGEVLKQKFSYVQQLPNGKFVVGNTPRDAAPIDPEGLFNDMLGDLADVVHELPLIAGQVAGSAIGTSAGPGGTILGGGIGGAAGEIVRQEIGTQLGVNTNDPMSKAVDVAISGMFNAGGEALGQALKFGGIKAANMAKRYLDRIVQTSTNPSKTLSGLSKILKITASVDPEDTVVAGTYGFGKSLDKKYMNQEYSRELMTQFVNGVSDRDKELGRAVGIGKRWAKIYHGKKEVELMQSGDKLLKVLSDPRVGLLDDIGGLKRSAFTESSDYRAIKNITELFFDTDKQTSRLIPKNLTVSETLDYKDRAKPLLNQYFLSEKHNPIAESAIGKYLDDIGNAVGKSTMPSTVMPTQEMIDANPYLRANLKYSDWKKKLTMLKDNGLDMTKVGNLKTLFVNGRVVSQKMENFFERFKVKNSSVQEIFSIISEDLPIKFPSGGVNGTVGTLADELRKFNAAQGFSKANPNLMRMAMVSAMAGYSLGKGENKNTAATLGAGFLLTTPAGTRLLLRGGSSVKSKLSKVAGISARTLGSKADKTAATAILSRLLQAKYGKDVKSAVTKKQ